ncbi:hypothetical protein PV326_012144 [Microctonus aethiopoides]|nr:hypothetical protein PV326_012144 [Microctonus aethiopoides]
MATKHIAQCQKKFLTTSDLTLTHGRGLYTSDTVNNICVRHHIVNHFDEAKVSGKRPRVGEENEGKVVGVGGTMLAVAGKGEKRYAVREWIIINKLDGEWLA